MSKYAKFVDVTLCDGCKACMVACKDWNDLPAEPEEFHGSYQSHEKLTANTWNLITFKEKELTDGGLDWLFRHSSCLHCTDAACEKVCPEDAISYTEFGSVVIDYEACVGCGYCVANCPFDAIHLAEYADKNNKKYYKAQKCTLCTDRLEHNLQPACADVCHTGAIKFGTKEEMLKLAQERLPKVKERFPNANIYDPQGVEGTHTVYLLAEKPSFYSLPDHPKVPISAKIWKDYAQPIGKSLFGATTMAVIGAYISNQLHKKGDHHPDERGGNEDESS